MTSGLDAMLDWLESCGATGLVLRRNPPSAEEVKWSCCYNADLQGSGATAEIAVRDAVARRRAFLVKGHASTSAVAASQLKQIASCPLGEEATDG